MRVTNISDESCDVICYFKKYREIVYIKSYYTKKLSELNINYVDNGEVTSFGWGYFDAEDQYFNTGISKVKWRHLTKNETVVEELLDL